METIRLRKFIITIVFFTAVILISGNIYAAPLDSGFSIAPHAAATEEEKTAAYREARFRVIVDASKYERVPYRFGGTDRHGFDCSGFVFRSFSDALGVSVPRNAEGLYTWVQKIGPEEAIPGDLVFFRTTNRGNISHVGIYLGDGQFIHAASDGPRTGVIYSSLTESYWARTFAGKGRVLPVAPMEIR